MRRCYGNDTVMLLCFFKADIYDDAYSSKNACFTILGGANSTNHDLRPLKYAIPADTASQHP